MSLGIRSVEILQITRQKLKNFKISISIWLFNCDLDHDFEGQRKVKD